MLNTLAAEPLLLSIDRYECHDKPSFIFSALKLLDLLIQKLVQWLNFIDVVAFHTLLLQDKS